MKITITAIIALCACALTSLGQNTYTIKGVTVDTLSKAKLTTTVTVLNAKDSILQRYTRSAADGSFSMSGLPAGKYLLWVTYPDYASYEETFTLEGPNRERNFGNIKMQDRATLLKEVVIKGEVRAIKIKGDTTEYNAKAFTIQPNDKVEDLLKQLPDVQVDKDGKITAQGERVQKVLVDGEEFFGDDPLLVTRNLRADMVDKVQIFNKKSDQAAFTGIDDGKTSKTINITLKEDKKSGVFGKAFVGVGNKELYDAQAMFNKFKGKYKLSAYGTTSNIGKNGLGFEDASKLGSTSTTMVDFGDGAVGYSVSTGDDYDNASYSGVGIPQATTGGVHFDTKWNGVKESINTNYRIGSLSLNTIQNVNEQLNFNNSVSNRVSSQKSYNHTFRQKADMIYQNTFDANHNLKFTLDGSIKSTDNAIDLEQSTTKEDGTLLNREVRSEKTNADHKTLNASFLFNKKFKKPSRTISWNVSEAFNQVNSKRDIYSTITTPAKALLTPPLAIDSVFNQIQPTLTTSSTLNSNITYTEPITTKFAVTLNYGFGMTNNSSNREAFNESTPGNYDVVDQTFSNNYKYNVLTNQLGALFNYRGEKTTLTFGAKASDIDLKQTDLRTGNLYKRSFVNWLPQATFRYKVGPSANYSLSYSGSPQQPTMEQIQPIRSNSNLLNIAIGNPDLSPAFRHNFSTSYTASKTLSGQYINFGGSYGFTENTIVNDVFFDPTTGKRVTQWVNFTENNPYNYSLRAGISRRILGITTELSLSTNYNKTYNYQRINNIRQLSDNDTRSYNASIYLQRNEAKKYSIYLSGGPNYTTRKYSATPNQNNSAFGYNVNTQQTVFLPGKFQISTDLSYRYEGALPNIPALVYKIWNASVSKTFLKGDNLKFSISGNNLFDQAQVNRSTGATGSTQTSYNNIGRYFMATITWDFTKFGTTSAPAQN